VLLYCVGGAAAIAYLAVTYRVRQQLRRGPLAAPRGRRGRGGRLRRRAGRAALARRRGGGGGAASAPWSWDTALALAAAQDVLRLFARGLTRMPGIGDALWLAGMAGAGLGPGVGGQTLASAGGAGGWGTWGGVGSSGVTHGVDREVEFAGGGSDLSSSEGSGAEATVGLLPPHCSPADAAAAAHRIAWSSALLYMMLGCFAAISLVRVLRKHSDKNRVRAVVRAMQKRVSSCACGGARPQQNRTTGPQPRT